MAETDRSDTTGPASRITREEALSWFVRMNSGDVSAADQHRFEEWLAADPKHGHEYGKLGTLWSDLDAVPDPRPRRSSGSRLATRRNFLIAAAGLGAIAAVPFTGIPTVLASDFRTGTGERKEVVASDGTRIELDAGTAIAEEFTPSLRRVRLLEGRAQFSVADDSLRPFEVACVDGMSRTRSAVLIVHRRPDDVIATVSQGLVEVSIPGARPATATAGECVTYGVDRLGKPVPAGDAETAWRRGRLVFHDRPLGDVVADLNRYRTGRIVIADRALAALRVDGVFDAARPDAALDALVSTLSLRALRVTDYLVVLRRAGSTT